MTEEQRCDYALSIGYTYDSDTGEISNSKGDILKSRRGDYLNLSVKINGKNYTINQHRFAWYYIHRDLPKYIDHKNHIGTDNRIENLRPATVPQNAWNNKNNSEWRGYSYNEKSGKYRSSIKVEGKRVHLGYFTNEKDAADSYKKARLEYHQI